MQNSAMYISVVLPCVYIFFNFVVSVDETITIIDNRMCHIIIYFPFAYIYVRFLFYLSQVSHEWPMFNAIFLPR